MCASYYFAQKRPQPIFSAQATTTTYFQSANSAQHKNVCLVFFYWAIKKSRVTQSTKPRRRNDIERIFFNHYLNHKPQLNSQKILRLLQLRVWPKAHNCSVSMRTGKCTRAHSTYLCEDVVRVCLRLTLIRLANGGVVWRWGAELPKG